MARQTPLSISRIRTSIPTRADLLQSNLQLQAQVAALVEDNKPLRAALALYSEVARRSPVVLPAGRERVA